MEETPRHAVAPVRRAVHRCASRSPWLLSVSRSAVVRSSTGTPTHTTRPEDHYLMNDVTKQALTKVPAVTLGFWVIKILATTLGETGGDTVTMTLNWGYLAGVALFGSRWSHWLPRRSGPSVSTRLCTGRRSWPRRPSAQRWPISLTDHWGSATRVDRFCFLVASWLPWGFGVGRREQYR